ncbi:restriction endonuclease subunit S [Streptomyces xanthophaeus]|uniref:restriction endonuclease subunit S n=1 Tax=Streptomyces xanthophaeus TaxID=67385 RepID=UPI00364DCEC2
MNEQSKWTQRALSEVGELTRGRRFTKSDYVESGLGCIHYAQIHTAYKTIARTPLTFLPEDSRTKMRLAHPGNLVIAATSENVDDVGKAVAWIGDDDVAVHDDCYIFRHELDPVYVSHFFASSLFQSQKIKYVSETKVVRISGANLSMIEIPVPPRQVQERIVEVIGAVDDQITALEAELEAVVNVRKGTVGRSTDTEHVTLGSLGVVSQGKGLPKKSQGKRTGDVSWYKIADMTGPGNEFGYTIADTRLTPLEVSEIGGVVVEAGAVTFPRVGGAILTEKKRIVDTPGALDENHLVITPSEGTNSEYLLAVMERFALSSLVRPGAVPSLNMSLIRSTKVPWSWTENQRLGAALAELRTESRVLAAEAASLRTTRAALLSGLLDRTIDIQSAELEA